MGVTQGCLWATLRSFDHIEMRPGGREEVLEDVAEDFPYLAVHEGPGWELRLRDALGEIWAGFLEVVRPRLAEGPAELPNARDERLKAMVDYVGRHYPERVEVADIAAAAFTSERECHRTFRECLGQSPSQYLREYRVQQACRMLAHTTRPVAAVARMCGLGSASHFGQVFRDAMGCTPSEYRAAWQKRDN